MSLPKLQSPLVLIHGLMGFSQLQAGNFTLASYFPTIAEALERAGNRVLIPSLSPTKGVSERAAELRAFLLAKSPQEPVHLIAHSMGGLDARYMISRLGMAPGVLSLTTLGTPHRGSSFADWGVSKFSWFAEPVFRSLSIPYEAFHDLTVARCQKFNAEVLNDPNVRYFSIGGEFRSGFSTPEWLLPHSIVLGAEGPNDGVVSLASAQHGETFEVWDGDHLSLVNWPHPFGKKRGMIRDPIPRFRQILQRLLDAGFR